MTKNFNSQEKFWSGKFGNDYIKRNISKKLKKNTDIFFKKIFNKKKYKISNMIELGANVGNNLKIFSKLFKNIEITAVEINQKACNMLAKKMPNVNVVNSSIDSLRLKNKFDLVLVKGVLIHIAPKKIPKIYSIINNLSKKYILIAEYYNPTPISILYRKRKNKLFKRDFAGEIIKKYKYELIDYGFAYRYDKFPQDDLTWFLLKKKN